MKTKFYLTVKPSWRAASMATGNPTLTGATVMRVTQARPVLQAAETGAIVVEMELEVDPSVFEPYKVRGVIDPKQVVNGPQPSATQVASHLIEIIGDLEK